MKNLFCVLLIVFAAGAIFGQKTLDVQDFSPDYYGKIYIAEPSEVFSKGWVAIYQKKTNKQLIKVDSDELAIETEDGKAKANVKELPYGEQSAIIYEDFNFDGVKDFAIMDGQFSCYHGPSFQIYLAGKVKNRFALSPAFTELAQEYCGMFEVDRAKKRITTMTKSGCCWHQMSEFIVVGNKPKAVKIVEEDMTKFPLSIVSTEIWNGTKMVKTTVRTVDLTEENEIKVLLSFKTQKGGDEIVLLRSDDMLFYFFINGKQNVELAYPTDSESENPTFTLDANGKNTTLAFTNRGVTYKIYETENEKIGVRIVAGGRSSDIPGNFASRKGSLRQLKGETLSNVTLKK
jgi:hypothetical protein